MKTMGDEYREEEKDAGDESAFLVRACPDDNV